MDYNSLPVKVSFQKIIHVFKRSGQLYIKDCLIESCSLKTFIIERGLHARIVDYSICKNVEVLSNGNLFPPEVFSLVFFTQPNCLQFFRGPDHLQGRTGWDTLVLSPSSPFRLFLPSLAKGLCLVISFSKAWIRKNCCASIDMVNLLEEKINYYAAIGTLMLLNEPEKNELKHMIMHAQKEAYVSFHLRSMILKFVATTLHKIRASDLAISQDRGNYIPFDDVECYLNQHKLKNLPDLKCLAQKFCISESTLKRQFKKHYGVSMSDYFYKLKFGYAEQLMRSKGITCSEAGQLIGYKNMQHFSQMFNKYYKSHSPYNEV